MTDNFERAQQRILKDAKDNGGVTIDHLFDALIATNEDLDLQHAQTQAWHQEVCAIVEEHCVQAEVRDQRLDELEEWRRETQTTCVDRVKALIESEHSDRHGQHMEEMHALDDEDYDMRKLYRTLKWALVVLGGGILLILADQIGNLIFGGAT